MLDLRRAGDVRNERDGYEPRTVDGHEALAVDGSGARAIDGYEPRTVDGYGARAVDGYEPRAVAGNSFEHACCVARAPILVCWLRQWLRHEVDLVGLIWLRPALDLVLARAWSPGLGSTKVCRRICWVARAPILVCWPRQYELDLARRLEGSGATEHRG